MSTNTRINEVTEVRDFFIIALMCAEVGGHVVWMALSAWGTWFNCRQVFVECLTGTVEPLRIFAVLMLVFNIRTHSKQLVASLK